MFKGHDDGTGLFRSRFLIPTSLNDPCTKAARTHFTAKVTGSDLQGSPYQGKVHGEFLPILRVLFSPG
jgi:hypothetical protein